ncbi:putative MFS family arabinose efflux permease [Nocardia alba]|uniref:Putative MFS family arabinose efflux permease n=2 Tax=Nocardia alba TaxID=225051 RepID=A0A4R1FM27_9NOCA|nr:putative MFS family arabinose efflux permease [Nocardia alba]
MALAVFVPSAIYGIGSGAAAPMLPLRALELGASVGTAGVVVAMMGFGLILGDLPAGWLVARTGERKAIALGSFSCAFGLLVAILAPNIAVFAVGLLINGASGAVWGLARQTYIVAVVPSADRGRAFSTLAGWMRFGFFAGPFLGAAAVHWLGPIGGLWIQLIAMLVAGALVFAIPETDGSPTVVSDNTIRGVVVEHRRLLSTLGLGALLMGAARAARQSLLPLWAVHIGADAATTSIVFGIAGAVDVLMSYPAGIWLDRYGRKAIGVPAMIAFAAGYATLPFAGSVVGLTAVAVLLGFANGLSNGVIMTVGADVAPPGQRAEFLGAWRLTHDIGMFAGPIAVGAISAVTVLGVAAGALAVAGLGGAAAMYRWFPGRPVVAVVAQRAPSPKETRESVESN